MRTDRNIRVVCPVCGEAHDLGLAALRDAPDLTVELIQDLAAIEASASARAATSRSALRRTMYWWCIVGTASLAAAGGYFGSPDLVPKWSAVTANLTSAVVAFTAAAYVVDLKIWSLKL